jgi:hypothetical protein
MMFYICLLLIIVLVSFPILSLSEELPFTEPLPEFDQFFQAITDNHWPLAVALGLTFLIWFLRFFVKDRVPNKYLPYVVLGIGVLGAVSSRMVQFINNDRPWWQGLIQGFAEGLAVSLPSMGWWSVGLRKLPVKKREEGKDD